MLIPGLEKISVETRFFPRLDFDLKSEGGDLSAWQRAIQPHVTATVAGQEVPVYSPLGRPDNIFPMVAAVAIGLTVVGAAVTLRMLRA